MTLDVGTLVGTIGFLVAVVVLARACADEGLFEALGRRVDAVANGSGRRLLALSVGFAAAVTAVLSLDATVVLLTPVLLAASVRPRESSAFASVRLSNSASTLLPVSNLTNLLVFSASGLTFLGFAGAMLPVWVVAVVGELLVLRWWFRREVTATYERPSDELLAVPLFPLAVVIVVLLALASGTTPWVVGTAGAIVLGGYALVRRTTTWRDLLEAASLPSAAVVLAWALVFDWLGSTRVGGWVDDLVPTGTSLLALVGVALVAMVLANLVNNLPATLLLLPAATVSGHAAVLALLIGVNVGANLTMIGSLANVLWWRSGGRDATTAARFHRLGLATTPALVLVCTVVLWAWTSVVW